MDRLLALVVTALVVLWWIRRWPLTQCRPVQGPGEVRPGEGGPVVPGLRRVGLAGPLADQDVRREEVMTDPRKRTVRATPPTGANPAPAPVQTTRPHPVAWATALRLAGGDARRLVVEADGAVTVANTRRR